MAKITTRSQNIQDTFFKFSRGVRLLGCRPQWLSNPQKEAFGKSQISSGYNIKSQSPVTHNLPCIYRNIIPNLNQSGPAYKVPGKRIGGPEQTIR